MQKLVCKKKYCLITLFSKNYIFVKDKKVKYRKNVFILYFKKNKKLSYFG